jgi:hypothetical protein
MAVVEKKWIQGKPFVFVSREKIVVTLVALVVREAMAMKKSMPSFVVDF